MSKKFAVVLVVVAFVAGLLTSDLFHHSVIAQDAAKDAKAPKWQHGLMMRARKGDEPDFTKDTKRYGVEVFEDVNNGNIIYISETGSISVVKK